MNRQERIRFFISEQCRKLDPTFRNLMYPKQVLLGDIILPLLPKSCMTFRVNNKKQLSFRIRLAADENNYPLNIGIPLSQVESISLKDHSRKHHDPAMVFILKPTAAQKFVNICGPLLEGTVLRGRKKQMCRYLTVILGTDPAMAQPNPVYCRVALLANKFTFPFSTAKKMLLKDIPLMWDNLLEEEVDRRVRTGFHHERQRIAEMDDEAWDWLMGYFNVSWDRCPHGGYWFKRNEPIEQPLETPAVYDYQTTLRQTFKRESPPSLLSDELLLESEDDSKNNIKKMRFDSDSTPESSPEDATTYQSTIPYMI